MVTEVNLLLQLKNNVYVRNTDFGMLPLFESVIPQSNPIASKQGYGSQVGVAGECTEHFLSQLTLS